jgi:uncharacterized protein YciI
MKHFLVEITYKIQAEKLGDILTEHRTFLQIGYDKGLLLCSGPKEPRVGGIVVARANSLEEIKEFFTKDPYALHGVAEHTFVEFNPVKFQPFLKSWIEG